MVSVVQQQSQCSGHHGFASVCAAVYASFWSRGQPTSDLSVSHRMTKTTGKVSMMLSLELVSAPANVTDASKFSGSSCA